MFPESNPVWTELETVGLNTKDAIINCLIN